MYEKILLKTDLNLRGNYTRTGRPYLGDGQVRQGFCTAMLKKAGAIKTWGTIDSAAKWLKKVGLGTMKLGVGKWAPNQRGLLL